MFVVMTVGASEAEVLGVPSKILAEGLTPFDHVGNERTVIAVVGEIGETQAGAGRSAVGPAWRRAGHPDQPPVQADVAGVPARGHRGPGA